MLSVCSDGLSSSVLVSSPVCGSSSLFTAALSECTTLLVSLTVVSGKEVLSVSEGWVIINESGGDVVSVVSLETESTFVVSLKIVSVITLVVSEISDFSKPAPLKAFLPLKIVC